MKRLHCSQCGANLIRNEDGEYFCEYCGSIYKSQREKGKVFIKDSYFKFNKDDEIKDIEIASRNSSAAFSYKKIKPPITIIATIITFIVIVALVCIPPAIEKNIEDKIPQKITYYANGSGYLLINGEKLKEYSCELTAGQSITVGTIADENYKFAFWSDNSSYTSRTDTKTGKLNKSYTAFFKEKNKYTLQYNCGEGGYIEGETSQTVYEFKSGTPVSVVTLEGYEFKGWSDGLMSQTRTDSFVTENINVTAKFYKPFHSGTGTENDPYTISTIEHYLNIAKESSGKYYKLNNSLNFKDVSVLDFDGFAFSGYLDGNGYTISNLHYSLFTSLTSSTIKNLVIDSANVNNTFHQYNYTGILANLVSGNVNIINCTIKNSSISLSTMRMTNVSSLKVGIMFGNISNNSNVVVDGCKVESTLAQATSSNSSITFDMGGLIGYVGQGSSINIKNTTSSGTLMVSILKSNTIYAGGLIGYISSGCTINFSNNLGESGFRLVGSDSNVYLGGLVGYSLTSESGITLGINLVAINQNDSGINNTYKNSDTINY